MTHSAIAVAIARFKGRASELRFESMIRVDHYPDNVPDFQPIPEQKRIHSSTTPKRCLI